MFTWKEISIYALFVIIILLMYHGAMKTEAHPSKPAQPKKASETIGKWERVTEPIPNKLNMTNEEIEYVLTELDRRAADDCVLERIEGGGFSCKELGSNKVFRVKGK